MLSVAVATEFTTAGVQHMVLPTSSRVAGTGKVFRGCGTDTLLRLAVGGVALTHRSQAGASVPNAVWPINLYLEPGQCYVSLTGFYKWRYYACIVSIGND